MVGGDLLAGDLDAPRVAGDQPGGALDDGGALLLVAGDLRGVVEVADHVVAVVTQRGPVQLRGGQAGGITGLGAGLNRAQQGLGGDARPVGALPADQLPLDQGHPQPAGQKLSATIVPWAAATYTN